MMRNVRFDLSLDFKLTEPKEKTMALEDLAFVLFKNVHEALGHVIGYSSLEDFNALPPRKAVWIEIVRQSLPWAAQSSPVLSSKVDRVVVDRACRFLGGLNLQDHPRAVQREAIAIVHELAVALGKIK